MKKTSCFLLFLCGWGITASGQGEEFTITGRMPSQAYDGMKVMLTDMANFPINLLF